jgi:Uma2 family endonuclease
MKSTIEIPSAPAKHVATGRILTIADMECLPTRLPSGEVDYELDNGRLVIVSPPGRKHGSVHSRISAFLNGAEEAGLGEAFTVIGIVLWLDLDRLVGADAAFVERDRCPVRETQEGYLETIPGLVVEIRSKDDTVAELNRKAADYLKAGVRVVWLIDPIINNAIVHRPDQPPQTVPGDGVLAHRDILGERELRLEKVLKL